MIVLEAMSTLFLETQMQFLFQNVNGLSYVRHHKSTYGPRSQSGGRLVTPLLGVVLHWCKRHVNSAACARPRPPGPSFALRMRRSLVIVPRSGRRQSRVTGRPEEAFESQSGFNSHTH